MWDILTTNKVSGFDPQNKAQKRPDIKWFIFNSGEVQKRRDIQVDISDSSYV
jgi:hypothetical protein